MKFDMVIFSKDRPSQLDLLLRSIDKYFPMAGKIYILYKSTNNKYLDGYNKLFLSDKEGRYTFKKEISFAKDIKEALSGLLNEYFLFLCDDDVFIDNVDMSGWPGLLDKEIAFSLRLSKGHNYCHPADLKIIEPIFYKNETLPDLLFWDWTKCNPFGDYGYPFSLDGNIYNTEYMRNKIKDFYFPNPNQLEIDLDSHRDHNKPLMVCFEKSKLVGVPANRVSDFWVSDNNTIGISAEEINKLWLDGIQIKMPKIDNPISCHINYLYQFENIRN